MRSRMKGDFSYRLGSRAVMTISQRWLQLRPHIPTEFQRKPRSLADIDRWKATEFRQFVLYTGPVLLQGILSTSHNTHFMDVSVAMYLMLCPVLCNYYRDYADALIKHFLSVFEQLYGADE